MNKKILMMTLVIMVGLISPSCQRRTVVKVVKPKSHWAPYKHHKHKRKKRTKIVRMKS